MTLVLIVRHGLTSSTGKALTGWLPGISLDDRGRAQAAALAARLAPVPLAAIVSSPLERCVQTASIIAAGHGATAPDSAGLADRVSANGQAAGDEQPIAVQLDERLGECRYGDWTGQSLRKLARDPLWRVVQAHPSAVRFPGPAGETMTGMQQRAVAAVRDWNASLGKDAVYVVCSHGDVIKAILADALGMHLDMSQRIQVDPCSLSVIRYTTLRPFVLRMNDTGADATTLAGLASSPKAAHKTAEADAQVGGGAGD
ncbi:MAG TPA: MSMEG_4193 family putative phosphomutase [Streptosporangiaceae bacterium]|nr:MSMEG_4193 family putative phosphomutase [Streptosporangiaceae bacterium]